MDRYERQIAIRIVLLFTTVFMVSCDVQKQYWIGSPNIHGRNYYVKDVLNHHDDIIGIWKWQSKNDSFELTLKEFEYYSDPLQPKHYRDRIYGKYKYIEKGRVKSEVNEIGTFLDFSVAFYFIIPSQYSVIIRDEYSGLSKSADFKILEDNKLP